jgi:hypothetical protein
MRPPAIFARLFGGSLHIIVDAIAVDATLYWALDLHRVKRTGSRLAHSFLSLPSERPHPSLRQPVCGATRVHPCMSLEHPPPGWLFRKRIIIRHWLLGLKYTGLALGQQHCRNDVILAGEQ